MKKLLFLSGLLSVAVFCVNAGNRHDDVGYATFKYGLTSITDNFSLDQHTFALDFIGEVGHSVKPKLDFSYVSIDSSDSADYLLQGSLNAYMMADLGYQNIFPYLYGGLGYEYVGGSRKEFDSSAFMQAGMGLEIPISQPSDDLHIVTEFRVMQLIGSGNNQDNEATFFLGLRLPLGATFSSYDHNYPVVNQVTNYAEFEDSVSEQVSQSTPTNNRVRNRGDLIADSDGDRVADGVDVCPNTPSNQAVNESGCAIRDDKLYLESTRAGSFDTLSMPRKSKILNVHFELNSDLIAMESREVVRKFVKAVNVTGYSSIVVEGYTDGTGRFDANQNLSQRRANSVRNLMVQYGIDPNKIQAIGKGSINPIASDDTAHGRAQNRRIEIIVK